MEITFMDTTTFDTLTRTISSSSTRRTALRGLVAGAATLVAGGILLQGEDAGAKRRKRGKGKGKGKTKVFICHRSGTSIDLIRVGSPAVKGHTKHGDTVCGTAGTCQTGDPIACDQVTGACTFAPAPDDTVCTSAGGDPGACAAGVCVV